MTDPFRPDENVYVDRVTRVRFVRYLDENTAIVKLGPDTRVVDARSLYREGA